MTAAPLDAPAVLAGLARDRARDRGAPVAVGIAGAVASGKSSLAAELAGELRRDGRSVEVVCTDGFLHANAVLAARGLVARKGFPESYDVDALRAFVAAVRRGAEPLRVPVYSHESYDIVPGAHRVVERCDIMIVEGVNALSTLADRLDVAVYLHAEESDLEAWFVARFQELRIAARDDASSFYGMFATMTPDETDAIARKVWREVNLVNLREHIAPSRVHAHCVVVKGPDHTVTAIEMREHGMFTREGS